MGASASAGHHLAAAEKEAGVGGGEPGWGEWRSQGHAAQTGEITAKDLLLRGFRFRMESTGGFNKLQRDCLCYFF